MKYYVQPLDAASSAVIQKIGGLPLFLTENEGMRYAGDALFPVTEKELELLMEESRSRGNHGINFNIWKKTFLQRTPLFDCVYDASMRRREFSFLAKKAREEGGARLTCHDGGKIAQEEKKWNFARTAEEMLARMREREANAKGSTLKDDYLVSLRKKQKKYKYEINTMHHSAKIELKELLLCNGLNVIAGMIHIDDEADETHGIDIRVRVPAKIVREMMCLTHEKFPDLRFSIYFINEEEGRELFFSHMGRTAKATKYQREEGRIFNLQGHDITEKLLAS